MLQKSLDGEGEIGQRVFKKEFGNSVSLIEKITRTGTSDRKNVSYRMVSVSTDHKAELLSDLICSQPGAQSLSKISKKRSINRNNIRKNPKG